MENGKESFTSLFGACISTVIIILCIAYGVSKLHILYSFGDSNLTEYKEDAYNSNTLGVDYETSKFNFALRINKQGNDKINFSTIFDFKFKLMKLADKSKEGGELLPTHQCNQTDFDMYFDSATEWQKEKLESPGLICLDDPNTLILDGLAASQSGEEDDS